MLESISCPSCSTHYGLRSERVHPGIRRARCLKCAGVFDIEQAVAHLLTPPHPAEEPSAADVVQADDFLDLDLSVLAPPEPISPDPALSLSDLEDSEDEIFDKTLFIESPLDLPAPPPAEEAAEGGSYASARDAISKLLGDAPVPSAPVERRTSSHGRGSTMDVEATLNALEFTLGGTPVASPAEPSLPPVSEPSSGSTVRLSTAELQAAMAAGTPQAAPPAQLPTMVIPVPPVAPPAPPAEIPSAPEASLLKIQIGQETHQNVTLEQMTSWIEHGRIQEFHMVARQFSDNWIEAGKVPSLRPIFERMRRTSPSAAVPREPLGPPPESAPIKKGLFGWMSGRS